jgi:hypothetical protein
MNIKTNIKAGGAKINHNQTRTVAPTPGLKIKTSVKAGGAKINHNQTNA